MEFRLTGAGFVGNDAIFSAYGAQRILRSEGLIWTGIVVQHDGTSRQHAGAHSLKGLTKVKGSLTFELTAMWGCLLRASAKD
jgi:hypothetical protein